MADNKTDKHEEVTGSEQEQAPLEDNPMEQFFYHQRRALEETGRALDALLPPGFKEHGTEASREFAKGFRVLVDAAIDELKKVSEKDACRSSESSEARRPASTGKAKVKVKVD